MRFVALHSSTDSSSQSLNEPAYRGAISDQAAIVETASTKPQAKPGSSRPCTNPPAPVPLLRTMSKALRPSVSKKNDHPPPILRRASNLPPNPPCSCQASRINMLISNGHTYPPLELGCVQSLQLPSLGVSLPVIGTVQHLVQY